MFTTPLQPAEYGALIDAHYHDPNRPGWALFDIDDRARGWHWIDTSTPDWADADAAFRAFVPDSARRRFLTFRGWTVRRIEDSAHLVASLLHAARGESQPGDEADLLADDLLMLDLPGYERCADINTPLDLGDGKR
ncbi:hypothetical protein [Mycobacteroides franklinii]|uniref:Uncharacterized protein n=1 Tax=Mycobacteroides franklinii TaxID=948102 RepID=A0A4V3A5J8_9MYCO|nr:hypothetical protein [Mycobacteroides franklinii]ORA60992.1 hypothetical protein BST24_12570 [Mycobacteroides franklinii]TDH18009.1 hypothetical protein EJ571_25110 [Mycobacteroides franklinii]